MSLEQQANGADNQNPEYIRLIKIAAQNIAPLYARMEAQKRKANPIQAYLEGLNARLYPEEVCLPDNDEL